MALADPQRSCATAPAAAGAARYLSFCWLLLLVMSSGATAQAVREAGSASAARPARSETQWLQAIQQAAERVNFVGTVVYQQGGSMRSSRVVHLWDGSRSVERLQMLDGKPREYIRRDTEVRCLIPEARRVLIESSLPGETFPSLGDGAPREILENYSVTVGATERVAGLDCQVLLLAPRDTLRYGYRLCVEPNSALLLRAQTLDPSQAPIDEMAFTDVRINEPIDRALLRPSWSTDGWKVDRSEHHPTDLAKLGWTINAPPGFRKLREVERRMGPPDAQRTTLQAVLSDGLATMSVFIDARGGGQVSGDLVHSRGALSGYTRRLGDALITVVGEIPPATAKAVAQGVTSASIQPVSPTVPAAPEIRPSR